MIRLYGIKTCDSVRKAVKFLKARNIDFEMVDFRNTPVGCDTIDRWLERVPVAKLFNTRGTTYRTLNLKSLALDDAAKRAWLCKENMLIKRPVVETDDGEVIVGYDENRYKEIFR
ncbi:arsenate reductase family protein [Hydrogenimonas cancrithermarum]|uniref:Arsenate reductase n=1 Tax=Hydrogenimonas cancrithermarum TaxID=2993563 RepID=A0ABN6WU49_9BACT|nr:arsenate reductase family protein [Hydrogenimonas cancrithermarum]BDY12284.1 arsenate reductase [Hydrogenimonas cancrithermarum]